MSDNSELTTQQIDDKTPVYIIAKDRERYGRRPELDFENGTLSYFDIHTKARETLVIEFIEVFEVAGHRIMLNEEFANDDE